MNLVSSNCVDFVKSFEGFSAVPYYDEVGVKTLGYGMTGSEIEGMTYVSESQATQMLEDLLDNKYAIPIKNDLDSRGVQLNQNQFDAIVSMAYNVGVGGVLGSTLYRNICNGVRDVSTITSNFEAWSYADGQQLAGLLRRRRDEASMFFGGNMSSSKSYLYKGDTGSNVKDVQNMLLTIGYDLGNYGADGCFGGMTDTAIRQFQASQGLEVDGKVGPNTYSVLKDAVAFINAKKQEQVRQASIVKYDTSVPSGPNIWQVPGMPFYIEKRADGRMGVHFDRANYLIMGPCQPEVYWNDNDGHSGSKQL